MIEPATEAVVVASISARLYPEGSPVRDAAQLRLIERLRHEVHLGLAWRSEVPVSGSGYLRVWDVVLSDRIGIDAETRLHDLQALQRRLELKWRDGELD